MDYLIQIAGLFIVTVSVALGQDCSALSGSSGKRFIFDDIYNAWNKLPKEIKAVLPVNTEVDAKCRFDLTSITDSQRQLLRSLYNDGYTVCVGCGYTNADHGRCHSIDVCRKGSSCIRAKNRSRQPDYYWHGCCDPSDANCKSGDNPVHFNVFGRDTTLHYEKKACTGPLCNENGYTDEKNALVTYLKTGFTPAPQTTTAGAAAIDGAWSTWSSWSACDKTCDLGLRTKTRSCTSPIPQNGGQYCPGNDKESEFCNAFAC
ncbi:semaphorin-5B-like [Mercenaria mercenaria]|uniref:semaphorin-5B-like n=1 Tax=Mercenaria mercenaria TaxID=6596 RepID=UPI00234E6DFA|nr:semaphorin-5B-like [Mercenaria mercenaria]